MQTQRERAGNFEVWAARAWNVFNEGRPFGVVYPPMALACAALIGVFEGDLVVALATGIAVSLLWACFGFALRGRVLLWALLVPGLLVLGAPWGLLAVGLGGWAFFCVVVWGSIYYHLRTGALWTNGLRFWRLVATNSDPTSGNALEQVPKLTLTFAAMGHTAGGGNVVPVAILMTAAAVLGVIADRTWARRPWYPEPATSTNAAPLPALARRVYVIVVDGCNRERLRQASALGMTPTIDRLIAEGTEYLDVQTAAPARTVVCFSSMLTGAAPAEHGMHSNFAPRLGVRVPTIFDSLRESGRHGRLVGIAHLLDPFGEEVVRTVTSVQPTEVLDHSLAAAGREVVEQDDPDLLVLQLLAADQLGHVRGTRNPEYLDQLAETDDRIAEFLEFLGDRLDGATVILMADHGQGRGIGGHGHLDWGESPVPFVVWGAGAVAGAISDRRASVCELAPTLARLLGVEVPAAARGRSLVPVEDSTVRSSAPPLRARALAIVTGSEDGLPDEVEGVPLDVVTVGDAEDRAGALRHAHEAGYAAAVCLEDGERSQVGRLLAPVLHGRAHHVVGTRTMGPDRRTPGPGDRLAAAWAGFRLGGLVLTDARSANRAFSAEALEGLTLGTTHPPAEIPIAQLRESSRSRASAPSRATSATSPVTATAATTSAQTEPVP